MSKSNNKKKQLSPFSREFWLEKGYTIEEADYKRNSIRPIRPEYWVEKYDYTWDDAVIKAKDVKKNNDKKGAKKSGSAPKEEIYKRSWRRPEYWINKGYSLEEAKEIISKKQVMFSYETCVEKYGLVEGKKIWADRQKKWQETLSNKPIEEQENMNMKKNHFRVITSTEELEKYYEDNNMNGKVFHSKEELTDYIKSILSIDGGVESQRMPEKFIQKHISTPTTQFTLLGIDNPVDFIQQFLLENEINFLNKSGRKQAFQMKVTLDENSEMRLLRSSYEIQFYYKCKDNDIKIKDIDRYYPNSSFRYDFLLEDKNGGEYFIEIAPFYNTDEKYRMKMDEKKELFGCYILVNENDFDNIISYIGNKEKE